MQTEKLTEILEKISSVSIAVIGDFCLDAYFFMDESASEISLETGLPTRPVRSHRYAPGGAGNLAANLADLGVARVYAIGVCGPDLYGRELIRIMDKKSIETTGIQIQDQDWDTHVYCKPCLDDGESNRIDFGNFNRLQPSTADRLTGYTSEILNQTDLIIINQQVPSGIHTDFLQEQLSGLIARNPQHLFMADVRDHRRWYAGCIAKINDREAASFLDPSYRDMPGQIGYELACKAGQALYTQWGKPVFVTCGERGSLVVGQNGTSHVPALYQSGPVDPVGAGDSYLSAAGACMAAGITPQSAAQLGSLAASVTVRKLFQAGTATPQEILQTGTDPDYIHAPELAEDIRQAAYHPDTNIEIIHSLPRNLRFTHAIFDHDGTISTLREGWEPIMADMMMKAILGSQFETLDLASRKQVETRVLELIDQTTGVQTLAQMDALTDLIREFGYVPQDQMLDMYGYKNIYNESLMEGVRMREKQFRAGELSREDFSIKNSVKFLEILYRAGIRLFLASGTDQQDVIHEAELLGYAHLFEGGIFGSTGELSREVKKMVIEQILDSADVPSAGSLITFGDGPVEIRATRKKGGFAVGVASDEKKRYGLNQKKRTRLIRAGAGLIIPDFSQHEPLLRLLQID